MSHEQIIRAWKDSAFRNNLSDEELALLPASPAGESLTEAELDMVVGGCSNSHNGGRYGYHGRGRYGHGYGYDDDSDNQFADQSNYQATSLGVVQFGLALDGDVNNYNSCNNSNRNVARN